MLRNAALFAVAVLVQGCQPAEQDMVNVGPARIEKPEAISDRTEVRLSYWGVGAPPREGPAGGPAARLDGILSRLGSCLVVIAGRQFRTQPVFPVGKATWNPSTGTLSFAGRDYREGDAITLGGGGITDLSAFRRAEGVEVAPCHESNLWLVIG